MQITNIQQAKKDKERVNIFVDGRFALGLDKNTLAKANLYKGKELEISDLVALAEQDAINYHSRKLLAWCFKRPRSSKEIKDKLRERFEKRDDQVLGEGIEIDQEKVTAEVLQKLARQGISDQEFSNWYVTERARQNKYGSRKVISDLLQKGVSLDMAKTAVAEHLPESDSAMQAALEKKFGVSSLSEISDLQERAKAIRFLQGRGFTKIW